MITIAWEQRKLGDIIDGKLSNGIMNKPGVNDLKIKHINVINMYEPDKIHINTLFYTNVSKTEFERCNVEIGDIFLTRSSVKPEGIAEANILLDVGKFVFDDHLIQMKVKKDEYNPIFIKISLKNSALKNQFIEKSKTTAFTTIGQDDILKCYIKYPKLNEQNRISKIFTNIDNLITLHQRECFLHKEV